MHSLNFIARGSIDRVQMSALLQLTTGLLGGSLHDHNVVTRFDTEA